MLIVDAQIHLWAKGTPSAHHRQTPYLKEAALAAMDAAGAARVARNVEKPTGDEGAAILFLRSPVAVMAR